MHAALNFHFRLVDRRSKAVFVRQQRQTINRRVPRTGAIDQEDQRENSQREAYEIRGVDGGRDSESIVRDL